MQTKFDSVAKLCLAVGFTLVFTVGGSAADWARFRGPNGSGVSPDPRSTPIKWSDTENLKWKVELPGPGLSSPIVVGERVLVTCWTGYAVGDGDLGDPKNLKRQLVCINRENGKTLWSETIDAVLPEDSFRGMFAENGYASHTPVSDGERVYVFLGKPGVLAFDLDGNKLWQTSVGTESDSHGWGSASSPVLYKNLVIVTAAPESQAMIALNKETGAQVWRQEAAGLSGTWGTPVLVDAGDGQQDLVLAVPAEVWAFNPDNGKLRWFCEGTDPMSMCSSVVAHDGIVYVLGARSGESMAIRAGGKGDVTSTHVLWKGRDQSRIATPIFTDGHLYCVNNKVASCIDAATGQRVYQSRLTGGSGSSGRSTGGRSSGFGGGGGFGGSQDYSSPVVADGKIYYTTRAGEMFVLALGPKFEQLSLNRFDSERGEFSASPAISDGELFIRSSKNLYCIAESK